MRLVGPGDIGRGEQHDGGFAVALEGDQLIDCPVLEHKVHNEHEQAQDPEDGRGGNVAAAALTDPETSQEEHGQAVDGP